MTAPGTKGPWIVNPFNAQVDCSVIGKDGNLLPVCQMLWPTDERSEAETEANAHLAAAAPCMFEALETFANGCIDVSGAAVILGYPEAKAALEAARTALSRARGETPIALENEGEG